MTEVSGNGSDSSWNVEDYRGDHESVEHWNLRKEFMIQNKGKYPQVRLVCLSQVFANMEFLGCRYPVQTMELVAELSTGIVEDYRQKQKGRLQRTFVGASAASQMKAKGQKRTSDSQGPTKNKILLQEPQPINNLNVSLVHQTSNDFTDGERLGKLVISNSDTDFKEGPIQILPSELIELKGLVIVDLLYTEDSPAQILHRSCSMSHKDFTFECNIDLKDPELQTICTFRIGQNFVVSSKGSSASAAKQNVSYHALQRLRKLCFTIQIKTSISAEKEVGIADIKDTKKSQDNPIAKDNIGNKLLRLMGWEGGALGKNKQGIEQAISVADCVGRSRLGLGSESVPFSQLMLTFLKKQIQLDSQQDLMFSSEFSSDERKIIHQIAHRLGLKSRSHGKGETRFLVISRKIQLAELVTELLSFGETDKYRVIKPQYIS